VGAAWSAPLDDRWRDLPSCWFLRPTPRPSCRRRARTRTCAPRAPRHQSARDSSRRRTPGPARPGICTPCAGSSSDLQSGSPTVDLPSWPNVVCLPRAVSTSPGSPGRSPRVFDPAHVCDGDAPPMAARSASRKASGRSPIKK
jgi:hypothetical protein